jgi:arylsulfatase A-like enzyme
MGFTTLPMHFRNHGYMTISNGKVFHHNHDSKESWDEIWHSASASRSWRDYALPENDYPPKDAPAISLHNSGELRTYSNIPEEGRVPDRMAEELIQGYYACVSYTDAQIGKVLDALRVLGLDRSTIVVLWGDHGWNLREHGMWCKHCNYETSLHTPLIVKVPGTDQVGSSSEIVEYVDIYPTLCELAGLSLPDHLQGKSFRELLFDPSAKSDGVAVCQWKTGLTTIRGDHFYTEWVDEKDRMTDRMLYDHSVDPGENVNISEQAENQALMGDLSNEMRIRRGDHYFEINR